MERRRHFALEEKKNSSDCGRKKDELTLYEVELWVIPALVALSPHGNGAAVSLNASVDAQSAEFTFHLLHF